MITFRPILIILFSHSFILVLKIYLSLIDFFDNLTDTGINLLVCLNLLCRIYEQDVCTSRCQKSMLLFAPAFSDSALEKISLYSSFEHLLGHGYHDPVCV